MMLETTSKCPNAQFQSEAVFYPNNNTPKEVMDEVKTLWIVEKGGNRDFIYFASDADDWLNAKADYKIFPSYKDSYPNIAKYIKEQADWDECFIQWSENV